jgi:hypothetical protein
MLGVGLLMLVDYPGGFGPVLSAPGKFQDAASSSFHSIADCDGGLLGHGGLNIPDSRAMRAASAIRR